MPEAMRPASYATRYGARQKRHQRIAGDELAGELGQQIASRWPSPGGTAGPRCWRASPRSSPPPCRRSRRRSAFAAPRTRENTSARGAPSASRPSSTTQSSKPQFMPCPKKGTIACAASPSSSAVSADVPGRTLHGHHGAGRVAGELRLEVGEQRLHVREVLAGRTPCTAPGASRPLEARATPRRRGTGCR